MGDQERHAAARPHAADTHHFAREVGELELLEQHAPIELEGPAVGPDHRLQLIETLPLLLLVVP